MMHYSHIDSADSVSVGTVMESAIWAEHEKDLPNRPIDLSFHALWS